MAKDEMPDRHRDGDVLLYFEWTGFSGIKYREMQVGDCTDVGSGRLIAWMPLPEPPKEEDE